MNDVEGKPLRKHKRYELIQSVIISNIRDYNKDILYDHIVKIKDISISGLGFVCATNLKIGEMYSCKINLFNKHVIKPYILIINKKQLPDLNYFYGAKFKGMSHAEFVYFKCFQVINRQYTI